MALPLLKTLEDCSDFGKTIQPFLPQLYELPQKLLSTVQQPGGSLTHLYLETNPAISGLAISLFLGAIFFVVAEINQNFSQVDRCWSLLPTFYIAHFDLWARMAGIPSQRLDACLLFSVLWSIRLTFNYARKGGYSVGSEDYRWMIVKNAVPAWAFHIFNLTFIAFMQSILLYLLAAPAYPLLLASQFEPELSYADLGAVGFELILIATEVYSDQSQWNYQTAKQLYQKQGRLTDGYTRAELERGFVTRGLFAHSRHPNFAAEQTIWCLFYQWSCYATQSFYNWTAVGPAFLLMIFQGSTWLTELITAGKYPEYKEYQKQMPRFFPGVNSYQTPGPKVIRTSELEKKAAAKSEALKQKQK